MPELPEVETCRAALEGPLTGAVITGFEHGDRTLRYPWPDAADLAALRAGLVKAVRRRGKYLILSLDQRHLIVHLGMSGQLFFGDPEASWLPHEHWRLYSEQHCLRYRDPRRFGFIFVHNGPRAESHERLVGLGPEPLSDPSFHGDYLGQVARGSKRPIKATIMDSAIVVGVGNIYASEALHRAGIHPFRRAGAISIRRLDALAESIRTVLEAAIRAGGTTLKDFRNLDGNPGYFRRDLAVYGRLGEQCRRCKGSIRQRPLSNRATYWCPGCQR